MTKKEKLIASLRNNPKAVRFEQACTIAEWLGFMHKGGKGSHCAFSKKGEQLILNFQNRNGYVAPYQARQLIEMVDKYEKDKT